MHVQELPGSQAQPSKLIAAAQSSIRANAAMLADGIADTSAFAGLAAAATLPLLDQPGSALLGLGGEAFGRWFVVWVDQIASWPAMECSVEILARALTDEQQTNDAMVVDIDRLLVSVDAVSTLLAALDGDTQRQIALLERVIAEAQTRADQQHTPLQTIVHQSGAIAKTLYNGYIKLSIPDNDQHGISQPHVGQIAALMNSFAFYLQGIGEYAAARPFLNGALMIHEAAHAPDHPDIARSLNNLAEWHMLQHGHAAARPLLERALTIYEAALGPEHPDCARILNNLAEVHRVEENYIAARPLYQRALVINETAFGSQHPDTATSLNNLAVFYAYQDLFAMALPLARRALLIRQQVFGPDHPNTQHTRQNLQVMAEKAFHKLLPSSVQAVINHGDPAAIAAARADLASEQQHLIGLLVELRADPS